MASRNSRYYVKKIRKSTGDPDLFQFGVTLKKPKISTEGSNDITETCSNPDEGQAGCSATADHYGCQKTDTFQFSTNIAPPDICTSIVSDLSAFMSHLYLLKQKGHTNIHMVYQYLRSAEGSDLASIFPSVLPLYEIALLVTQHSHC